MAGVADSLSSSSSEDLTHTGTDDQPAPVDILLQRRKCELMYELKRLEHGERPVTGSESRGKVGTFITRQLQQQESSAPVANMDDVEEHRPEQVTIEVQGLIQRRSVSSLLQTNRFRRSLENVFRTHFTASSTGRAVRRHPTESTSTPPVSTMDSPAPQEIATESTNSSQSTLSSVPEAPSLAEPASFEDSFEDAFIASLPPPPPATIPTAIHPPFEFEPQRTRPVGNAEALRIWNQEQFVMEISDLVHRQLVTSTLGGDFGNRLERHIANRIAATGSDGLAVREQILRLPPSNIRRNDFSHLGIPSIQDQQQQLDDAVSVISATASASIPFAQSNAAVQREMSAMKVQIAQLSNMLKMSLDLQLDIQRSIRQEVAAAISQSAASNQGAAIPAVGTQLTNSRADDTKCIICVEGDSDAVLYRCGHICMCYTCALRMRSESGLCPVCRAPINDILRAYRISHE